MEKTKIAKANIDTDKMNMTKTEIEIRETNLPLSLSPKQ